MNKDMKNDILKKIEKKEIKPKPKSYFQLLKIGIYGLSVILFVLATYTINLIIYLPTRTIRQAEQAGTWDYLSLFPWPLLIFGAGITGLLIYIYRNYEGGYKKRLLVTTLIVFALTVAAGGALANSNLNEALEQTPRFRRMYEWQDENFVPRGPKNKIRRNHQERIRDINQNNDEAIAPPLTTLPLEEKPGIKRAIRGRYIESAYEQKAQDSGLTMKIQEYYKVVINELENKFRINQNDETINKR